MATPPLQIQDPRSVDILYPDPQTESHRESIQRLKDLIDKAVPQARKISCTVSAGYQQSMNGGVVAPFSQISPKGTKGVLPPVILNSLRRNWAFGRMEAVMNYNTFWMHCSSIACFEFVDCNKDSPELPERIQHLNKWYPEIFGLIATHDITKYYSLRRRIHSREEEEAIDRFHVKYKIIVVTQDQTELTPEQIADLKEILAAKPPRLPLPSKFRWSLIPMRLAAVALAGVALALDALVLRTLFRR